MKHVALLMLLASSPAFATPPPITNADDDPARFVLSGSAEYQHRFGNMIETGSGAGGDRIKIEFQPTVAFLPASITIDVHSGITQADLTLLRLWIVNLLAYHRNTDASIAHDFEFLSANVPVFAHAIGSQGGTVRTNLVVTVGAGLGYRWMTNGDDGLYIEPTAGVMATSTILNRIFASAYLRTSATAITGEAENYLSAALGAQIGVGITRDNMLRFVVSGGGRYDGANPEGTTMSGYLGAGIQWGAPQPMLNNDVGLGRR
jgi:hypothetical protein